MSVDRNTFKRDAMACLAQDKPVGELVDCVTRHCPDVQVFREKDDLVIKGGLKFLIVKRVGSDQFRVSENVAVPSTNIVDSGGGRTVALAQLIDEISALDD